MEQRPQAVQQSCTDAQTAGLGADLDTAPLHNVQIFHLTALVVDDGFGREHLLRQHVSQALYCAGWQALELWHL